jgi:hypothetical protein
MKKIKRLSFLAFIALVLLFPLSGCHLFDSAKQKLNLYCPGLKIDLSGVNYSVNGARDVYVLSYDESFQKQVAAYFQSNGFTAVNNKLGDIEVDDENMVDPNDNMVAKEIKTKKQDVEVVFNQTTRRIIIIENAK